MFEDKPVFRRGRHWAWEWAVGKDPALAGYLYCTEYVQVLGINGCLRVDGDGVAKVSWPRGDRNRVEMQSAIEAAWPDLVKQFQAAVRAREEERAEEKRREDVYNARQRAARVANTVAWAVGEACRAAADPDVEELRRAAIEARAVVEKAQLAYEKAANLYRYAAITHAAGPLADLDLEPEVYGAARQVLNVIRPEDFQAQEYTATRFGRLNP